MALETLTLGVEGKMFLAGRAGPKHEGARSTDASGGY